MFISHVRAEASGLMAAPAPRRWAALLSCAIHGLFVLSLLSITTARGIDPAAGALTIELIHLAPPEPPPPPPPTAAEQPPPPQAPLPQPAKPTPAPRPTPTRTTPAPQPAIPAPATAAASAPLMTETAPSPEAPAVEKTGAIPIASVAAREASLNDYTALVWARVMRHRPDRVRFSGTAAVRFTLAVDGRLITAEIAQSSGSAFLDQAALTAVERAAPFPPAPADAGTDPLGFLIPFHFR